MATAYTTLVAEARAETRDLVYHSPITRETPLGDIDGANTTYYLANKNIASVIVGGVQYGPWVTLGTNKRSLAAGAVPFTIDSLNGILTMTTAPATPPASPWFIDYYFQWFTDADYSTWIDQATLELGQSIGQFAGGVTNGGDLTPALIQYVVDRFWTARASLYAQKYASSAAGANEAIQTVTTNYLNLAKAARAKGDKLRVSAYVNPGGKQKAASGSISYGMPGYTPRR